MDFPGTVSYTHLDVYKRQQMDWFRSLRFAIRPLVSRAFNLPNRDGRLYRFLRFRSDRWGRRVHVLGERDFTGMGKLGMRLEASQHFPGILGIGAKFRSAERTLVIA